MRKQQKLQAVKREKQSATKKPSTADFLTSPPPQTSDINHNNDDDDSPKCFKFNMDINKSPPETTAAAARITRRKTATGSAKKNVSPCRNMEPVSSIEELKELASSRLDSIKRQTERSHSDILKEVESSNSRLQKRFKIQTQSCQKLMDDTDKELKKMMERITESCEAMKASYDELQAEAQTSHSRVCKTSIPEKTQQLEDAINALRSRYVTT
ncbi:uncharacterized protein LOC141607852 [Silene latifolia]|uniref:uncharacterized protein LOC141607852 n=1 Tax=Silene latifolia TaxID=37657 RepID=UPI003D7739B6